MTSTTSAPSNTVPVSVEQAPGPEGGLRLIIQLHTSEPYRLHWGLADKPGRTWSAPPQSIWPAGTVSHDRHAVQSPLTEQDGQTQKLAIDLPASLRDRGWLCFVLYNPQQETWQHDHGRDYAIELAPAFQQLRRAALDAAADAWDTTGQAQRMHMPLDDGSQLMAAVHHDEASGETSLLLISDSAGSPHLHWGLAARRGGAWQAPPREHRPERTEPFDDKAVRSAFEPAGAVHQLALSFAEPDALPGTWLQCVIFDADQQRWIKHQQRDIGIALAPRKPASLDQLVEQIARSECGDHSWTLMHRFNLAVELLEDAADDRDALELIYVWLRFSQIRQLDWQRKFNTKPRELAHAQDRLTQQLAQLHVQHPELRPTLERMIATVGRGGPGQRVRDGVLEIMHRHRIKEVHGTWLEQWHQKLHNNTTPDDLAICDAYINFLAAGGDVNAYDNTLKAWGIDRQRLASFERPIVGDPDDYADRRDGLIHDLRDFFNVLKTVHAGDDLESSINAAAHALDHAFIDHLRHILHAPADDVEHVSHRLSELAGASAALVHQLEQTRDIAARRDLLYLDVALRAQARTLVEKLDLRELSLDQHRALAGDLLGLLASAGEHAEHACCRDDWPRQPLDTNDRLSLLYAIAVSERASRAVRDAADALYETLQPKAELLGERLQVDDWVIPIFADEVLRSRLDFVLGRILRVYEPTLREAAGESPWQIVSDPGSVQGELVRVDQLQEVQGKRFDKPTLLLAERVHGHEDIPPNVLAIITAHAPDVLSHVAIRARNASVMLVGCGDADQLEALAEHESKRIALSITRQGELAVDENATGKGAGSSKGRTKRSSRRKPEVPKVDLTPAVLGRESFEPQRVGAKALTQSRLRDVLPDWIHTPAAIALSFGVFHDTLEAPPNAEPAKRYRQLLKQLNSQPEPTLAELRSTIAQLTLPDTLHEQIRQRAEQAKLELPEASKLHAAIKGVWASQWTDRAYWARQHAGIEHDKLHMAVLIQQAVPADYAFIIHTSNPLTRSDDELFVELVVGLGETLASNFPGRAMSFTAKKASDPLRYHLRAMASKSTALIGEGIVCRSDSNSEDLPGFAGAGLYDSLFVPRPREQTLRYREHRLTVDHQQRDRLFAEIVRLGSEVERALGAPQDIEAAAVGDRLYLLQSRPQVGL